MHTAKVSKKGQIVIPATIRKKLGLKKGMKVVVIENATGVFVQPLDRKYFDQFAGILPKKGRAVDALLRDRQRDSN